MFNKYYINNLKKNKKKHIFVCIIAVRFLLYYLSIFIITALFIIDPQLIEKNKFHDFTSIKNVSINKSGNLLYCPNLVDKCHSTNRRNNMGDKLGLNCKFAETFIDQVLTQLSN